MHLTKKIKLSTKKKTTLSLTCKKNTTLILYQVKTSSCSGHFLSYSLLPAPLSSFCFSLNQNLGFRVFLPLLCNSNSPLFLHFSFCLYTVVAMMYNDPHNPQHQHPYQQQQQQQQHFHHPQPGMEFHRGPPPPMPQQPPPMMRQPSASSTNIAPEFHHPGPGGPPGPPPHYDGSIFLLLVIFYYYQANEIELNQCLIL